MPSGVRWGWALAAAAAFYYLGLAMFPSLFRWIGVDHQFGWFVDSHAILSAVDATRAGLDVSRNNPLDVLGRPHVYSDWWLGLSMFGLGRDHNFLLGGLFSGAFFAALVAWLRPRSFAEAFCYFAMLASPPAVLVVERANNDALMFAMLAAAAAMLASGVAWVRWCAMAPMIVAGGLKYYPAGALAVWISGGSRRETLARCLTAAVVLGVIAYTLKDAFGAGRAGIPEPLGLQTFGATQAFIYMGLEGGIAKACGLAAGALLFLIARPSTGEAGEGFRREWIGFLVGAVILTGCFFAAANFSYRLVFALLMAPWLWRAGRDGEAEAGDVRRARLALWLLIAFMWMDGAAVSALSCFAGKYPNETIIGWGDRIALAREPVVWGVVYLMMSFLKRFFMDAARTLGLARGA